MKKVSIKLLFFVITFLGTQNIHAMVSTPNCGSGPITAPPLSLGLHSFYKKFVPLSNFPIVSSSKVPDLALLEACRVVGLMTSRSPWLLAVLVRHRVRLAIMSINEVTTDIPEHSDLTPKEYWDWRARGLGPTLARPAVSSAEENVLCYGPKYDRYHGESILIHEFAHAIHLAITLSDFKLNGEILAAYALARGSGLWKNTYAATNVNEYFAEATQSWFNTNIEGPLGGDGNHNNISTRARLISYDHRIAHLLAKIFGADIPFYACP